MSKADANRFVEVVHDFLTNSRISELRKETLDVRIQGFAVPPDVILKEIKENNSPFQYFQLTSAQLSQVAQELSDDLWDLLHTEFKSGHKFEVVGNILPPKFYSETDKNAMAYDSANKVAYYRTAAGSRSTNYKGLGQVWTDMRKKAGSRGPGDLTHIFLNPDPKWAAIVQAKKDELRAADPKSTTSAISQQARKLLKQPQIDKFGDMNIKGAELGHVFGATATSAASLTAHPEHISRQDLSKALDLIPAIPAQMAGKIETKIRELINADTEMEYERRFTPKGVTATISILVPESKEGNTVSGRKVQEILKELKILIREVQKLPLAELSGSPSYNQLLIDYVVNVFLEKPNKTKKYLTKAKKRGGKQKIRTRILVNTIDGAKLPPPKDEQRKEQGDPTRLAELITLINNRLHDQIRINMGKGRSGLKLNYRTGRFAKSALVETLYPSREKNAINARVRYFGFPYSRFADKGDTLYRPLRDPKGIFGRSIRQILQEEKIATLRRVKVELTNG